jgi:undecaprenyl-diphosphatase
MDILNAIILGIIQGLTEFLPVSSSGHLELGKAILGDQSTPEASLLLTVVLHAATALSTVVVFWKDILQIFRGLFQFKWNEETEFSLKIILSMVPAAIIGVMFEAEIEQLFDKNVLLVGAMLLITGLLLFLADRAKDSERKVGYLPSLIIGISQAIAILPGISRSGATISTSVLLGIDRGRAARFSFLMVLPLIFGKMAKDLMGGKISTTDENFLALSLGFVAAFLTGIVACRWMIALVKRAQLHYFAIYCFVVGAIALAWSYWA